MITTDIQIRFSDIDMLGHVNNIVLQQYYDLGKVQYFSRVLNLPPLWSDEAFIAVNTNTDYFEEVHIDNVLSVTTKIVAIGSKSITFEQDIVDQTTQVVKSHSRSVLVAFDLKARAGILVRDEHRQIISAHEGVDLK